MYPGKRLTTKKLIRMLITAVTIAVGYFIAQNTSLLDNGAGKLSNVQPGYYLVEEVSDGDTIIVNMNGTREIIRMIGIDTPETKHPNRPVQCYGKEAAEFARLTLVDKQVRLEADPLNTNRDRYDRLLRYVYMSDGTLFNAAVIEGGYGFSYTSFPFSKTEQFNLLENQSKEAKRGLWSKCSISVEINGTEQTNPAP